MGLVIDVTWSFRENECNSSVLCKGKWVCGYWPFLLVSSNTEAIHCFRFESKGKSGQLFTRTNQCAHHERFSKLQSTTISAMERWVCLQRYWGVIYWERVSPFDEMVWKGIITLLLYVNEVVWKCFINFLQLLLLTKIPVSVVVGDFERPQMKYYCWWDLLFKLQDPNIQKVKQNADFNRTTWNGFKFSGHISRLWTDRWTVINERCLLKPVAWKKGVASKTCTFCVILLNLN